MLGRLAGDEFALFVENLPAATDNRAGDRRARARAPRRARPPVPAQPARALRHRQRRHRPVPARRRQRRRPDPRRGRGDVLLQAERRQQPQLLHAGDERRGGRAADDEGEAAARGRARRAGDPLPAEGGPARRARGRRRGAGAMAAAGPRRHLAGAVHPARRGVEPDPGNRRVGAEARGARLPLLAGAGAEARPHLHQPVAEAAAPGRVPDALPLGVRRRRRLALELRAGDHRDHPHDRGRPHGAAARRAARDGPAPVHRRLRHRLLVAVGAAAVPGRHAQDRPVLRAPRDGVEGRRDARAHDHRDGQEPRPQGRRRGHRDAAAARLPAQPRLPLRPGPAVRRADVGRGFPRSCCWRRAAARPATSRCSRRPDRPRVRARPPARPRARRNSSRQSRRRRARMPHPARPPASSGGSPPRLRSPPP